MKAKLLLRRSNTIIDNRDGEELGDDTIELFIWTERRWYPIYDNIVDDNDKDGYLSIIEKAINEAVILLNAIPELKLVVDDSVYSYFELYQDEIRKFIRDLSL